MSRYTYYFILSLAWILVLPESGRAQEDADLAYEAGSYFDGAFSNWSAWGSGDVLIKVQKSGDSTESVGEDKALIIQESKTIRFAFDHEKERYFFAIVHEGFLGKPDMVNVGQRLESNGANARGLILDGKASVARFLPTKTQVRDKNTAEEIQKLKMNYGIPELRGMGLYEFDRNLPFQELGKKLEQLAVGAGVKHIRKQDNTVFLEFQTKSPRIKDFLSIRNYRFDAVGLVPTKVTNQGVLKGEKGFISQLSSTWAQVDGVFVPKRILEELNHQQRIDGVRHRFRLNREIEFHWLSFNEDLDEALFDKANIEDAAKLHSLVTLEGLGKKSDSKDITKPINP